MPSLVEFFVGIGDINSAFLPKVVDPLQVPQDVAAKPTSANAPTSATSPSSTTDSSDSLDTEDNGEVVKSSEKAEKVTQNTIELEA